MIRLVCYSDQNMTISRKRCIESARKYGIEDVHEWDEEMLHATEFYQMNPDIFIKGARGAGSFWVWKAYIIYKAMLDANDGDIILYMDAGVELINDPQYIINVMDEDVFLFGNNWNHVDFCKGDVLEAILPNYTFDSPYYVRSFTDKKQVQASVIFIRVSKFSREFIKSWLMYCQMPNLINDEPSKVPNYPTFRDGRHDQQILTCIAIKYGLPLHYWCATYNNGMFDYEKIEQYKNDNYPILFLHHRLRDNEY